MFRRTARRPAPRTGPPHCRSLVMLNTPPTSVHSPRRRTNAGSGNETHCSFPLENKTKTNISGVLVLIYIKNRPVYTRLGKRNHWLPFHKVTASNWCSFGWPNFPDPPVDHFKALDTNVTLSGEFWSIWLKSFARLSAQQTEKRRRPPLGWLNSNSWFSCTHCRFLSLNVTSHLIFPLQL